MHKNHQEWKGANMFFFPYRRDKFMKDDVFLVSVTPVPFWAVAKRLKLHDLLIIFCRW